jgi:hypothetical protein
MNCGFTELQIDEAELRQLHDGSEPWEAVA